MSSTLDGNPLPAEGSGWEKLCWPQDAHGAAHVALLHRPSGCALVKFWYGHPRQAGRGVWMWYVLSPDRKQRTCVGCVGPGSGAGGAAVHDMDLLRASAEEAIGSMCRNLRET